MCLVEAPMRHFFEVSLSSAAGSPYSLPFGSGMP